MNQIIFLQKMKSIILLIIKKFKAPKLIISNLNLILLVFKELSNYNYFYGYPNAIIFL
jgi:hypothetical protein